MSTPSSRVSSGRVVRLEYDTKVDPDYLRRHVIVRYVRLMTIVSFQTPEGWLEAREAIIDTGGPISLIPRRIWEQAQHRFYSTDAVEIPVGGRPPMGRLGQVTLRLHDAFDSESISPPLTVKADLLSDNSYPIVLGFEDFLTAGILYSDYLRSEAYLSFPSPAPE